MKKLFITALIALASMTVVNAQTSKADVQASKDRVAKLQELLAKQPKECGVSKIDDFAKAVNAAAALSIKNSETLSKFYYREIGQTEDGVTDVTVKKPTLKEWEELGVGVGGETVSLNEAKKNAEEAAKELQTMTEDAKNGNPMAKAKKAKQVKAGTAVVNFGKDALPILAEETVAQAKMVKDIIQTLKSGKNL
jgi:hypothetical protein